MCSPRPHLVTQGLISVAVRRVAVKVHASAVVCIRVVRSLAVRVVHACMCRREPSVRHVHTDVPAPYTKVRTLCTHRYIRRPPNRTEMAHARLNMCTLAGPDADLAAVFGAPQVTKRRIQPYEGQVTVVEQDRQPMVGQLEDSVHSDFQR